MGLVDIGDLVILKDGKTATIISVKKTALFGIFYVVLVDGITFEIDESQIASVV